ncbi:DUF1307 domain-containing protein [Liquorilactobacillus uvarum]|uniref:DUF1307 domain-containing protein n=1 Tax=Liquorilactobacillus uvarum TaxID=303240 RepID=UPI00288BEFB5|nr:DUF1307 domain-containing protein [Liquorilactobacillus uvarum]
MKRYHFWGSILSIFVFIFILAACSLLPEKQVHYQRFRNGTDTRLTYYARRDKVTRQETQSIILYSALGVTDKESAQQILAPFSRRFQGIDGLTEKITYKKTYAQEKLTIDYSKVDIDKIKNLPGMYYSSNAKSNNISLKKSEELLKKNRFVKITGDRFKKFTKKELTQKPYSINDFNKIQLASTSIDSNGTTVAELRKQLGRPDRTQKTQTAGVERSMYLWYLSQNKVAYVSVYTIGEQIRTKTLSRYSVAGKNISSTVFDSLENGTDYDAVITALGEPARVTMFYSGNNSYTTLIYRNRTTNKNYRFYFTNNELVSKSESN